MIENPQSIKTRLEEYSNELLKDIETSLKESLTELYQSDVANPYFEKLADQIINIQMKQNKKVHEKYVEFYSKEFIDITTTYNKDITELKTQLQVLTDLVNTLIP